VCGFWRKTYGEIISDEIGGIMDSDIPGKTDPVISETNNDFVFAGIVPSLEIRWRFFESGAAFAGLQWSKISRGSRKWSQEKFRVN
jgi:hypothetical protein